jgi:4-hydroxy-tetrahydrodipicolinate reductase
MHILKLTSPAGNEEIILTHSAVDRTLFARSAVIVAHWLAGQKPGFYDMEFYTAGLK